MLKALRDSQIWKSIFRHGPPTTARNRAMVMLEGRVIEELQLPEGEPTHPYARMLFDPWGEHDLNQSTAR